MTLRNQLLVTSAFCVLLGCGSKPTMDRIDTARELVYQGKHEEAIRVCQDLLNENPNDYQAMLVLGQTHLAARDLDQAISDFTRAIECKPDKADAYYLRANAYRDKGEIHRLKASEHEKAEETELELAEIKVFHEYLDRQVEDDRRGRLLDPTFGVAYTNNAPSIMQLESLKSENVDLDDLEERLPNQVDDDSSVVDQPKDAVADVKTKINANATRPGSEIENPKSPYQKLAEKTAKRTDGSEDKDVDNMPMLPVPPAPPEIADLEPDVGGGDLLDAPPRQVTRFGFQGDAIPMMSPPRSQPVTTGIRSGNDLPPAQGRFYLQQQTPNQDTWPAPLQDRVRTTGITSSGPPSTGTSGLPQNRQTLAGVGMGGITSTLPFGPRILTPAELQNQRPAVAPVWGTASPLGSINGGLRPRVGPGSGPENNVRVPGSVPTAANGTPIFAPDLTDPNFTPFLPSPGGDPSVE
jgi:hypothetical protein